MEICAIFFKNNNFRLIFLKTIKEIFIHYEKKFNNHKFESSFINLLN